jgi:hypothetical protein
MPAGVWQPRVIQRFVEVISRSTRVMRVDTDAGEGYLKALGNPEGPQVLACELVGTLAAEWLGVPTLDSAVVTVTAEDELPMGEGRMAGVGPAFITRAEKGIAWGGDEDALRGIGNPEAVSGLVVLDTWIRNCDRYRPEPQWRVNRDNVYLS